MMISKQTYTNIIFLFLLLCAPSCIFSDNYAQEYDCVNSNTGVINDAECDQNILRKKNSCRKNRELSYYLYTEDFIKSFIDIPTANVLADSTTLSSKYLAGRAPVYNVKNEKVGTCSASFLCIQNDENIYTDISNYLSIDNGLIVTWFTPTTLINLELDNIIHSMVTECIVLASTKVGFNPFYGKQFNMVVSSDDKKIYFKLSEIKSGRRGR